MGRINNFVKGVKGNKTAKGVTAMGVAGAGLDAVFTYASDQAENPDNSQLWSATKGIATGAAWLVAEPLMWGVTIGQGVAGIGKMVYEDAEEQRQLALNINNHVRTDASGAKGGTLGGEFINNEATATMRQRQMDLLRQHKMSTESILGSEARQLHR